MHALLISIVRNDMLSSILAAERDATIFASDFLYFCVGKFARSLYSIRRVAILLCCNTRTIKYTRLNTKTHTLTHT